MARTMSANLTGARLREVDQALREARGATAVDALMKAHSHEARVLQHLFEERRAGRPAPPLARIARVMVWSDGAMEFRLVDASAPPGASGPRFPSDRPAPGRPSPAAGAISGSGGRLAGARTPERTLGQRGEGSEAPTRTGMREPSRSGVPPRLTTSWVGGGRLPPVPRQWRPRPGDEEDTGWRTAPRVGDGWSVVRPGDAPPMDPGDPEEAVPTESEWRPDDVELGPVVEGPSSSAASDIEPGGEHAPRDERSTIGPGFDETVHRGESGGPVPDGP